MPITTTRIRDRKRITNAEYRFQHQLVATEWSNIQLEFALKEEQRDIALHGADYDMRTLERAHLRIDAFKTALRARQDTRR